MRKKKKLLIERKLTGRPLILDGAIGSILQSKIGELNSPLWSSRLNMEMPELVRAIHEEYINAGAEIISTNTFRTNPAALKQAGLLDKAEVIVKSSLNIIFEAIEKKQNNNVIIAGSNPPAEDSYQRERTLSSAEISYNHKKHIELLWESGSDFILNETQSHFDEIKIITEFCTKNEIPFVISLFFDRDLNILSGESLRDVIEYLSGFSPLVISMNCIKIHDFNLVKKQNYFSNFRGLYLNAGSGNYTDKNITCGVSPVEYLNIINNEAIKDFVFVGSCCGSNPEHTRLLKEGLSGEN